MNINAQEIIWIIAINQDKIKSIESFIKKFCEFETTVGNSVVQWLPYKISKETMIIPKDENDFFHKLYDFTRLIDKLIANELVQFGTKPVGINELLPIFRKEGQPFPEVWELLKNKQGLTINSTPQLKEFISDDFLTREEKRYIEERHQRIKSEFLTLAIAVTAVIALITTVITLLIVDTTTSDKNIFMNQEFAYYSAIAERKMLYSENVIEVRVKALIWLDKFKKEQSYPEKKNLISKWHEIDEEIKINNSATMIYSDLGHDSIIKFDELLKEISTGLINTTISDSLYNSKRNELAKRFKLLIKNIRETALGE